MKKQLRKQIAYVISTAGGKGSYPLRRALSLAEALHEEAEITFLYSGSLAIPPPFASRQTNSAAAVTAAVKQLQPDLLIRDSGSSIKEETEALQKIVPSLLHIDDFGDGAAAADTVIQTLYAETYEPLAEQYISGHETFIADRSLQPYIQRPAANSDLPHLVVSFGDEDPGNLTFRALRHIKQLQIPLRVSILIGSNYAHDVSEIQLMALSRRNTAVICGAEKRAKLLAGANIVLCDAGYTPYEVAAIGIPCIVLAQNEFESSLGFPAEQHGFIHLGLGRKVTQSNLLNAVMELLLHEARSERAVKRQQQLQIGTGGERVLAIIRNLLAFPKRTPAGYVTLEENSR